MYVVFTDNVEDAQSAHDALDAMTPQDNTVRRTSVQTYELLLNEQLGRAAQDCGGSPLRTSCSTQVLPSGSAKSANDA